MSVTARRLDDLEQNVSRAAEIVGRLWDDGRRRQALQRWIDEGRLWCDDAGWHARPGDENARLLATLLESGRQNAIRVCQLEESGRLWRDDAGVWQADPGDAEASQLLAIARQIA